MAYKYTAIIYTYADRQTHDVRITSEYITADAIGAAPVAQQKRVHKLIMTSEKKVRIPLLTCWMKRKFVGARINTAHNYSDFTAVKGDLSWVISIVNVEFDYHVGNRQCLEPEHAKALKNYIDRPGAGFDMNMK